MRIEGEGAPGEASTGTEPCDDALERATPIRPTRQVQQGSERADPPCGLVERELAHIASPQVELDTGVGGPDTGLPVFAGERDVEGDVLGHVCRPLVVAARERLVPAHVSALAVASRTTSSTNDDFASA